MFWRKEGVGNLEFVPIRDIFPHEAHNFSTWMEKNINILSIRLGIPLTVLKREQPVGKFFADLVCQDAEGNQVIIENQLEKTDHDHLGKLMTYMGGTQATTVIWVTPEPRPEHMQAIANLNNITKSDYEFYLVKVEGIKIDNSRLAPLFTPIITPESQVASSIEQVQTNLFIEKVTVDNNVTVDTSSQDLPPVWCVYPRRERETYDLFLTQNVIGIGFSRAGDFSQVEPTFEAVKQRWAKKNRFSFQSDAQIRTFASIMYRFAHLAEVGNLVIYPPTWLERKIYIGEITSSYRYDKNQMIGYNDLRSVRWIKSFDRDLFSEKALNGIRVSLAFFQVQSEAFLQELANHFNQ